MPLHPLVFLQFEVSNAARPTKCYFAGPSEKEILEHTSNGTKYGSLRLANHQAVTEDQVSSLNWESPLNRRLEEARGTIVCLGSPIT